MCDDYTCRLALQGISWTVYYALVHVFLLDAIDGTRNGALRTYGITNHHHLLEGLVVFTQGDVDGFLSGIDNLFGDVTDVGNRKDIICLDILDCEVTIQIGGTAVGGAFDDDVGTDDAVAEFVTYYTCHGALCKCCHCRE